MSKRDKHEAAVAKHMLDRQLDQELEDTFPASDALKITRTRQHEAAVVPDAERDRPPVAK